LALSRQAASRVRAAQLEERCLDLRASGLSFREIARNLNVVPSTAYKAVARGLAAANEHNREEAASLRDLEVMRLDQLQAALWTRAIDDGDHQAIDRVLRIMERRAKLLGLDAPTQREIKEIPPDPETARHQRRLLVQRLVAEITTAELEVSSP
jgi:DNA-binding CsgD family transcriptional regulator